MILQFFFLQVVLPRVVGTGWSVKIPHQIRAFSGDCVVIPCSFTLADLTRIEITKIIWYQEETQKIIFHSKNMGGARGIAKASLVDDLQFGNCSLWIRDITREESMMYRFLIEVHGVGNYTSPSSVDLRVSDVPPAPELQVNTDHIIEGDKVVMTCRTNHSCNLRPPLFVWNHVIGEITAKTVDLENGIWQFISTQIVTASISHHGVTVNCHTKYMKIRTNSSSYIMNVLYSPKNTTATVKDKNIREGQNVSLWCSSQSNPDVSQYIWNGLTDDGRLILLTGNKSKIVIPDVQSNIRSVHCTAQNAVGIQTSPAVELNITYKPQITQESYCRPSFTVMECTCIVKANPQPFVIWYLPNSNITKPEGGYDLSTIFSNHLTKSLLKGPASTMTSITCYSENKAGFDELILPVYVDISKYLVIACAVGIAAFLVAAVSTKLLCHSRKKAKEIQKSPEKMYKAEACNVPENQNDLYGNYLYGNDLHENSITGDEEVHYSTEPSALYSVYECPEEFDEEPVYANT